MVCLFTNKRLTKLLTEAQQCVRKRTWPLYDDVLGSVGGVNYHAFLRNGKKTFTFAFNSLKTIAYGHYHTKMQAMKSYGSNESRENRSKKVECHE